MNAINKNITEPYLGKGSLSYYMYINILIRYYKIFGTNIRRLFCKFKFTNTQNKVCLCNIIRIKIYKLDHSETEKYT